MHNIYNYYFDHDESNCDMYFQDKYIIVVMCMAEQNHDDILHAYYMCVVGTVE